MKQFTFTKRQKYSCAVAIAMILVGTGLVFAGYPRAGQNLAGVGIGFAGGLVIASYRPAGGEPPKE
jgi:hypothetical protein